MTLTFGSLFAGIGGFDLGFERAGMRCLWQVEIDPFCRQVLAKHWPDVVRYEDVRECGTSTIEAVDVICGGFPCQPFSQAGEQRGEQDDRNLWPEMRRIIAEIRPHWVVAENVPGIRNIYLDQVLSDLEGLDYTAGAVDLPAVAFGAPHIRHRLFIVAYTDRSDKRRGQQPQRRSHQRNTQPSRNGAEGEVGDMAIADGRGCRQERLGRSVEQVREPGADLGLAVEERRANVANTQEQSQRAGLCQNEQVGQWGRRLGNSGGSNGWWLIEPAVGRVAHGIPDRVDRLKALGNAVVPQVAEWLGRRIVEVES